MAARQIRYIKQYTVIIL